MLAWAVREAVTNVVRHSAAADGRHPDEPGRDEAAIEVVDDGRRTRGAPSPTGRHGLRGLRERWPRRRAARGRAWPAGGYGWSAGPRRAG